MRRIDVGEGGWIVELNSYCADAVEPYLQFAFAGGEVGIVAGIEPLTSHQLRRGLGIAEIAGRGRGPAKLQAALAPFRQFGAGRIDVEGLVTDVLTFEQFPAAFEALRKPTSQCKILLAP